MNRSATRRRLSFAWARETLRVRRRFGGIRECRHDDGVRQLWPQRRVIGEFELNAAFRFGGVPFDIAERGLKLFAKVVLPVLKSWRTEETARAAE